MRDRLGELCYKRAKVSLFTVLGKSEHKQRPTYMKSLTAALALSILTNEYLDYLEFQESGQEGNDDVLEYFR